MTERLSLSGYGTLKFCLDDFPISLSTRVTKCYNRYHTYGRKQSMGWGGFCRDPLMGMQRTKLWEMRLFRGSEKGRVYSFTF